MQSSSYWERLAGRHSRRRLLLAASAAGAVSLTACRGSGSGSRSAPSSTAGASGPAQPGGTLVWMRNKNDVLDPQRVSSKDQESVAGVYSRVFQFKTGLDPEVSANHDLDPDLGLSAESPDAMTWTVKLRSDAVTTQTAVAAG